MNKFQFMDAVVASLQMQKQAIESVTGLTAIATKVPANKEFSLLTTNQQSLLEKIS